MSQHKKRQRLILVLLSQLVLGIGLSVLIDRAVGALGLTPAPIVLPPDSHTAFQTTEFSYTVNTNSLGFRGEETSREHPGDRCRIAAIGDSFTYGWGVDLEESWPYLLEQHLNERGIAVEVLNLGHAGFDPLDYAVVAERSRMLAPDMVLLAIHQLNDFNIKAGESIVLQEYQTIFSGLYPNLQMFVFNQARNFSAEQTRQLWAGIAAHYLSIIDEAKQARFDALEPEIQDLFLRGMFNPYQIIEALEAPDSYAYYDLEAPNTVAAREALQSNLETTARTMQAAPVLILSIPHQISIGETYKRNFQRLGFNVADYDPDASIADEVIEQAAEGAGLPFYSVTDAFRAYAGDQALYFELDTHFTEAGHLLYAQAMAEAIEEAVRAACQAYSQ